MYGGAPSSVNGLTELSQCTYYPYNRDFVSKAIQVIISFPKNNVPKYIRIRYGQDILIQVNFGMPTNFNGRQYEIPVKIIFPKGFPNERPQVFLENQQGTGINSKNTEINQTTKAITTQTLARWTPNNTLYPILEEIQQSFQRNFPIYKLKPGQTQTIQPQVAQPSMSQSTIAQPQVAQPNMGQNTITQPQVAQPKMSQSTLASQFGFANKSNPLHKSKTLTDTSTSNQSPMYSMYNFGQPAQPNMYSNPQQGFYNNQMGMNRNNNIYGQPMNAPMANITGMTNNPYGGKLNTNPTINNQFGAMPNYGMNNNFGFNPPNYGMNSKTSPQIPGGNIKTEPQMANQSAGYNNVLNGKDPEELMKNELITLVKEKVEPKINEEKNKIIQQSNKLKTYKKHLSSEVEKLNNFVNNSDQINLKLNQELTNLDYKLGDVSNQINSCAGQGAITSENAMSFVNGTDYDFRLIDLVAREAYYEDLINAIKKAFRNESLDLQEALRYMRLASREELTVKYLRRQMLKQKI